LWPEIQSYKVKMSFFKTNGEWDVGADCPVGYAGPCAPIPSGLPETPFYPGVLIAAAVPCVFIILERILSMRAFDATQMY
jgi:hypothetical protein